MCKIDFQVRIEYDEHVLTPQHLQQESKSLLRKEKFEKDPKCEYFKILNPEIILLTWYLIFSVIKLRENEVKITTVLEEANDVKEKGDVVLNADDKELIKTILDEKEIPE